MGIHIIPISDLQSAWMIWELRISDGSMIDDMGMVWGAAKYISSP